jgi:hypothetical protein
MTIFRISGEIQRSLSFKGLGNFWGFWGKPCRKILPIDDSGVEKVSSKARPLESTPVQEELPS